MIVRLDSTVETETVEKPPPLKDCAFPHLYHNFQVPLVQKIIIFGTKCQIAQDLKQDLNNHNKRIRDNCKNYKTFDTYFLPVRCWHDRTGGTFAWLINADPTFRKLVVKEKKGKAYLGYMQVYPSVADYVGTIGCYI